MSDQKMAERAKRDRKKCMNYRGDSYGYKIYCNAGFLTCIPETCCFYYPYPERTKNAIKRN